MKISGTELGNQKRDFKDIVRGMLVILTGTLGRMVARVTLIVLVSRAYSPASLGHLGELVALIEISAALCTFGLSKILLKELSEYEPDAPLVGQSILTGLLLVLIVSVPIMGIAYLLWDTLSPGPEELTLLLIICIPIIAITEVMLTATRHARVMRWDAIAKGFVKPWSFLGLVLLAYILFANAEQNIWALDNPTQWTMDPTYLLFLAYVGSLVLTLLLAITGLFSTFGRRHFAWSKVSLFEIVSLGARSYRTALYDAGSFSLRRIDILILGLFVGAEGTGLYYAIQQIATVFEKPRHLFEPTVAPVIAQVTDKKDIQFHIRKLCGWILLIQIALMTVIFFADQAVLTFFSPAFVIGTTALLTILLAESIDGTFGLVDIPLIYSVPGVPPILIAKTLAFECIAISILASLFGVLGAAIGFLISMLLLCYLRLKAAHHHLQLNLLQPMAVAAFLICLGTIILRGASIF